MLRGRPSKPAELKKLTGTRPSRMKEGQITGEPLTKLPAPPDWLNDQAKVIFTDTCRLIMAQKSIYEGDVNLLAVLSNECYTYQIAAAKLQDPENMITTTSTGYQAISPWTTIRNQSQKNIRDIGALFGLDPTSRARLGIKEPEPLDEFEQLLKQID